MRRHPDAHRSCLGWAIGLGGAVACALGLVVLLATLALPLRADTERRIAFHVYPFDVDRVRVEAAGAADEEVRWVIFIDHPRQRWTSARGMVAYVDVLRGVPMLALGEVRDCPGGRLLGVIGGTFTYDGDVHPLPMGSARQ